MKVLWLLAALALTGCPDPTHGPPEPRLPDDTPSCASACAKLAALGCEEGQPLEDGTTCKAFCEATQNAGHALNPSCIVKIKACAEMATVCGQGQ